jgi:hypothetical protein
VVNLGLAGDLVGVFGNAESAQQVSGRDDISPAESQDAARELAAAVRKRAPGRTRSRAPLWRHLGAQGARSTAT